MHRTNTTLGWALCLALATCATPSSPPPEDEGGVDLVASLRQAASIPPVAAVWVHLHGTTARGAPVDLWEEALPGGAHWQLSFQRLPIGAYLVGGRAFSDAAAPWSADPDYQTTADVPLALAKNDAKQVVLVLQQNTVKWPPAAVHNQAPRVDGLVASSPAVDSADPPEPLELTATASDPDGPADIQGYAWEATLAPPHAVPGAFTAPAGLSTSWLAPVGYEGTATITFSVSDERGARSSVSLAVHVSPRNARGNATATVRINSAPDVTALTASTAQLPPRGVATLAVTASDADGDALRYAWSDDCLGTFLGAATDTVDWRAPSTPGPCTLTVTVGDWTDATPVERRGPTTTSTLVVNVAEPVSAFAPEFVYASQAPASPVAPLATVFFRVAAEQPTGDPVAYVPITALEWSDGRGGAFTPVGPTAEEVRWVAPSCVGLAAPFEIPVTVTATGTSADPLRNPSTSRFTFPVVLSCP